MIMQPFSVEEVTVRIPDHGDRDFRTNVTDDSEPADEHAHGAPARMGWARLL